MRKELSIKTLVIFIVLLLILFGCSAKLQENNKNGKNEDSSIEDVETQPEEYIPRETDVVFKNNAMRNVDILEKFIETAGANGEDNQSQIRIVKYEPQGALIYELQSRYDENANQSWIDVQPDLSYFDESAVISQDVFYNAPQQCWYMSKDTEQGYYKFHECRTNWEYHLFPIVERTLSYEELINPIQTEEEIEIIAGQYYDLHDIAIEIFLSKKDAKEWHRHFEADNQEKMEEVTDNNVVKLMQNNVNIAKVTDNEVLVTSCEEGLCEVYTDHSFQIRGFVVPEVRINKETEMAEQREQLGNRVKSDSETFWIDMKTHIEGLLEESSELITTYQSGESEASTKDDAKLFHDKVNGRTNILRHIFPEEEELVAEYYHILMSAELLFNSVNQGKYYFENAEENKLEVLLEEEIIPLREELEDLIASIKELQ